MELHNGNTSDVVPLTIAAHRRALLAAWLFHTLVCRRVCGVALEPPRHLRAEWQVTKLGPPYTFSPLYPAPCHRTPQLKAVKDWTPCSLLFHKLLGQQNFSGSHGG